MKAPQTVLVTGATGVLGTAIVTALCSQNYRVVANFWRDEGRADELSAATNCALHRADVRDEIAVRAMFEAHGFDAVIHAAGANSDALLLRTSNQHWREQMRWADAAFLVTRASLEFLPRGGRLMLISSRVGERGGAGQSAYATQKGALLGLMRAAAVERDDLKINALCPGFAASKMSKHLRDSQLQTRLGHNVLAQSDARENLAAACVFLMTSSLRGQIVRPDCRI